MTRKRSSTRTSPGARLDALQKCLAGEPAWPEVLTRLGFWPPEEDLESAVGAVEAVVDRWPAATRGLSRLVARQLLDGQVRPYVRLIGALDLRLLWRDQDHPTLLKRMIDEAGLRTLAVLTTRYDRGDELAGLVARHVVGLQRLCIGGSGLGAAGARALAGCAALAGLTSLNLANNALTDADAELLLRAEPLAGLRSLNVYGNRLGAGTVAAIRSAPRWAGATIVAHGQRPIVGSG